MSVHNLSLATLSLLDKPSLPHHHVASKVAPVAVNGPQSYPHRARNKQCMPSDDEMDDEEDDTLDLSSSDEDDEMNVPATRGTPIVPGRRSPRKPGTAHGKKTVPLPSDDEDEDDDAGSVGVRGTMRSQGSSVSSKMNGGSPPLAGQRTLYRVQGVQSSSHVNNLAIGADLDKSSMMLSSSGKKQRHSAGEDASRTKRVPTPWLDSNLSDADQEALGDHLRVDDENDDDDDDDRALAHCRPSSAMATRRQQQQQQQQQQWQQQAPANNASHVPLTHGSHLQQWQQMQHQHREQLAQFQHHSQQHHHHTLRHASSMTHIPSAMEMMKQLEHDKAEAKRQKPRLNPSNAKIEGLLGQLPEPGAHNVSFQFMHQQHQQQQMHMLQQQHLYQRQQQKQQLHQQLGWNAYGASPLPTSTRHYAPSSQQQPMQQQQQQQQMRLSQQPMQPPSIVHQQQGRSPSPSRQHHQKHQRTITPPPAAINAASAGYLHPAFPYVPVYTTSPPIPRPSTSTGSYRH
ncbi:hypothetical protein BC940DRAFT_65986 [Gongronella butleri]|nr:hypothetical protein BC940DRAFT_65986 [Gongronella butleri]